MDGVYEALTGQPSDEGLDTAGLIERLADVAGSGSKAARLVGVSPVTFNRWRRGVQRPKTGPNIFRRALRRALLSPQTEADVRGGRRRLVIVALGVVVSNETRRRRTLRVGDHIPKPVMSRILTSWLTGDDEATHKRLWNAIDKYYLGGMEIGSVESVDFR